MAQEPSQSGAGDQTSPDRRGWHRTPARPGAGVNSQKANDSRYVTRPTPEQVTATCSYLASFDLHNNAR